MLVERIEVEKTVRIPPKLIPVFEGDTRYRGAYGGRGSGKTQTFAKMSAVWGYIHGMAGHKGLILCGRELMNSLEDSSLEEVKQAILGEDWLRAYYEVGDRYVRSRDGRIRYGFAGLRHNLDSIKSKSRIILAWIDEAEQVSEIGWQKLIPTVREDNSEIWVTWNPEHDDSPTHKRFRADPPDGARIVEVNWRENPWFPAVLELERLADQRKRPDDYDHIWEGGFRYASAARIFRNYRVAELEVPDNVIWFYGVDWGFSIDPLAGVRFCFPDEQTIYITHECYRVGVPTERIPAELVATLPGIVTWPSSGDSARPDTIDYVRRHGVPRLRPALKGQGSVEDGIVFLQGFDIVMHPRCTCTLKEFQRYSYKRDRQTEEILPVVEDLWNHAIDALRYGAERAHRKGKLLPGIVVKPKRVHDYGIKPIEEEDESSWRVA